MTPGKTKSGQQTGIPPGFKLRHTLRGYTRRINRIAWSPDGRMIASPSDDGTIKIWDAETGKMLTVLKRGLFPVYSVTWSPDGRTLASGGKDKTILLWDVETAESLIALEGHKDVIFNVAWSPDGQTLASGDDVAQVWLWDAEARKALSSGVLQSAVLSMKWSPDSRTLALGMNTRKILYLDVRTGQVLASLEGHTSSVYTVAWSPGGQMLASGSADSTIRIWDAASGQQTHILEGHTGVLTCVAFSADGRLLASKALDGTVRLWRTDTWLAIAKLIEPAGVYHWTSKLAFHPKSPILATLGESERGPDTVIRIWDLDHAVLFSEPTTDFVKHATAKIVLVGESNVGKSCLAMRLAEDRYPDDHEHGTTHGMRFWPMEPGQLSPAAAAPEGQRREVVLWDMGGQDAYRLVHQLFLHDTTLALLLLDPTRGRAAFDDVQDWNKRLEKQLSGRQALKLLVGSKLDDPSTLIDRQGLEQLLQECGFAGYYETSARTGRGIDALRRALAEALDWERLALTSRPELFQRIRDEIEARRRQRGEVVLLIGDLERRIRQQDPETYDPQAVGAVAEQLALQGVIALTRLTSGERALVLQIGEIERYAGSLIVAARENPRGVPALEEQSIASPELSLPGIAAGQRLPRLQERVVLECAVSLMVEHGICFWHEGLLVFPSLFPPISTDDKGALPHSVSLYYDFSGAIDNIYASLVVWLVMGEEFGRVRLAEDRAEFQRAEQGACGLRKVDRGRGLAHVDVYFDAQTTRPVRQRFISFVENHLRQHGVEIVEHVEITCVCGHRFQEETIRARIVQGKQDIGCPECDRRTRISEGAKKARERDPELERQTWALRTKIEERRQQVTQTVKQAFAVPDEERAREAAEPIRVLHLSDLHFTSEMDPTTSLQPLAADIHDAAGGLGFERLDYLVISGDLTQRATPQEFETAFKFVSEVIGEFELTAERCIIAPGNHDLSWEEDVYDWKQQRRVTKAELLPGCHKKQGDGYLVLNAEHYPNRLKNFSNHFYHPLVQKEYPLAFEEQCLTYLFDQTGLQFITLNSAWQIDEWFRGRSSVQKGALARGLRRADEQIKKSRAAGRLAGSAPVLRIGVWHHPVTGNEKIVDDAFMERLRQANVHLCLHGHVHEDRADLVGYLHPRRVHVAGAGSFGAPAKDRPESTPRLYNLLEITRDHSAIKVHTRCMRKDGGAWEGWKVWPGAKPTEGRSYYVIGGAPP